MIDACSFEYNSSESSSNTFNIFQRKDDLLFSINIGIENTKNMNEFVLVNNSDRGLLRYIITREWGDLPYFQYGDLYRCFSLLYIFNKLIITLPIL